MTEDDWLSCSDPGPMLDCLPASDRLTDRKAKLFACACVRRAWHRLTDERSRRAVETVERYADGAATEQERTDAETAASEAAGLGRFGGDDSWHRDSFAAGTEGPAKAAAWALTWPGCGEVEVSDAAAAAAVPTWDDRRKEFAAQADLLRDIVGNLPC